MSQQTLKKSIEESFPYYSEHEQTLLHNLIVEAESNSPRFKKSKDEFLKLLYEDLVTFYDWKTLAEDRVAIRQRLLNVAGLFFVVPIDELRELSHKAKLTQKKLVYETPPHPKQFELSELHSYDLKFIQGFSDVYSKILIEPQVTVLDYIAGNREKRRYPLSQMTVFRKSIQDEVISKDYLTASAEPLTLTQFISIYNPNGTTRDLLTIGFDLVYESAFIEFFHHAPNVTPITLPRNAHIIGKHYLLSAVNETLKLKRLHKDKILEVFPLFIFDDDQGNPERVDDLLFFISDHLIPQITQRIKHWNIKLGLDPANEFLYWGQEEE